MNKNLNDDAPLFTQNTANTQSSEKLALEKVKQDGKKFTQLIGVGTKAIKWIVIFSFLLIIFDGIFQKVGMDNTLIIECFSLVKYSLTTILGFVFASNSNKS